MASSPSRSPLAPTEIFDRLRAQFGDDVVSTAEAHGHLVVTVKAARYPEIATFLRDDPSLDFLRAYVRWFDGRRAEARTLFLQVRDRVTRPEVIDCFLRVPPG